MEKRTVITSAQLVLLLLGSAVMIPYTTMPAITLPPANQDVWMIPILSMVYRILLALPLLFLVYKFKSIKVNECFEILMGKIIGRLFMVIFVAFFIFAQYYSVSASVLFINSSVYPETPRWALALYILVPIAYTASKGAGTMARLSAFIVPYILVTIVVFFMISFKDIDLFVLKPIFVDSGFAKLNLGAFLDAHKMTELIILLVFSGNIDKDTKLSRVFAIFLIVFTVSMVLMIIPTITILGLDVAKHMDNPYFVLTKQVRAYDFIQRLESFNVLGWFIGILLKMALYNYMSSYFISGITGSKTTYKMFVIPVAIVIFILIMIPKINQYSTFQFLLNPKTYAAIALTPMVVVPIIMCIVYLVRKDKVQKAIREKVQ